MHVLMNNRHVSHCCRKSVDTNKQNSVFDSLPKQNLKKWKSGLHM